MTLNSTDWISPQPSSRVNLYHRKWQSKPEKILMVNLGFKNKRSNLCLYLLCEGNDTTIIASHVDDLLLAGSDFDAMARLRPALTLLISFLTRSN